MDLYDALDFEFDRTLFNRTVEAIRWRAEFFLGNRQIDIQEYKIFRSGLILGERLAYIWRKSSECKEWKENITNLSEQNGKTREEVLPNTVLLWA